MLMSSLVLVIPVVVLIGLHSHFADRRLRNRGHDGRRYRVGFFLGISMYILTAILFIVVMNEIAAGHAPLLTAVVMLLALISARGIGRRRRYGWTLLAAVAAFYAAPYFLAGILSLQMPGWALSATIAATASTIFVYAGKRWIELRPGWPIPFNRLSAPSVAGNDAPSREIKPIVSDLPSLSDRENQSDAVMESARQS